MRGDVDWAKVLKELPLVFRSLPVEDELLTAAKMHESISASRHKQTRRPKFRRGRLSRALQHVHTLREFALQ